MADIDIINPEARRFIVVRRPDAPSQIQVDVALDPRVATLNGDAEGMQVLEKEITTSGDLANLVKVASDLQKDASWKTDLASTRTKAEQLLAVMYPPQGGGNVVIK